MLESLAPEPDKFLRHFEPDRDSTSTGPSPGAATGTLLHPAVICWRCHGDARHRVERAYRVFYEHGGGETTVVKSTGNLGELLGMGPTRASDLMVEWLEPLGLAQVEVGVAGRGDDARPSLFWLTRPETLPVCKPGCSFGAGIEVSEPQPGSPTEVPIARELTTTTGQLPSPVAKPDWALLDDDPTHERWRNGQYCSTGWAMTQASQALGHPWMRLRELAAAVGVHTSTVSRILNRMIENGDATRDPARGFKITPRLPVTKETFEAVENMAHRTDDVDGLLVLLQRAEYDSDERRRERQSKRARLRRADRALRAPGVAAAFESATRRTAPDENSVTRLLSEEERRKARRALRWALGGRDAPAADRFHEFVAEVLTPGRATAEIEGW